MAFLVLTIQYNRIPNQQGVQQELITRSVERTRNALNNLLSQRPEWNLSVLDVTTDQTELIPLADRDRRRLLEQVERELDNPTELERILAEKLTRRGQ